MPSVASEAKVLPHHRAHGPRNPVVPNPAQQEQSPFAALLDTGNAAPEGANGKSDADPAQPGKPDAAKAGAPAATTTAKDIDAKHSKAAEQAALKAKAGESVRAATEAGNTVVPVPADADSSAGKTPDATDAKTDAKTATDVTVAVAIPAARSPTRRTRTSSSRWWSVAAKCAATTSPAAP